MSRGFSGADRAGGQYLRYSLWALFALILFLAFLRGHPPRPIFTSAMEGGSATSPWPRFWGGLGGGAIWFLLLLPAGGALSRLIGFKRKNLLLISALGSLYAMATTFALLSAGVFHLPVAILFAVLPLIGWRRPPLPLALPHLRPPRSAYDKVLLALICLALATGLVQALAPLTGNDSLVYHMTLAAEYARSGAFSAPDWSMYARIPHGIELLYAGAYLTGAEGAARIVHLLLYAANIILVGMISRHLTGKSGLGGAFLFALTPLFLDPRTVGNVDLGASLFFGLALYQILLFRKEGQGADLAAAGLFAGGLLWVKYASWSVWPLLPAILLLMPAGKRRKLTMKEWLLFLSPSLVTAVLWFARAWMVSGHPLFPLALPAANSAGWDAYLASRLRTWQMGMGMGRGFLDWLLLPWNVVMNGQSAYSRFDGVLSPHYLAMLPLSLLLGGSRLRPLWIAVVAGLVLWALGPQQLRFLSPVLLLACALLGDSWRGQSEKTGGARIPATIFLLGGIVVAAPHITREWRDTLPVVVGSEGRQPYLSRQIQSYEAFIMLDQIVPPGEKVLLLWENRTYYSPRPTLCDSFFEASQVVRLAGESGSAGQFVAKLREKELRWILVNRPLQNIFARQYDPAALSILEETIRRSTPFGSWKGLELYRLPQGLSAK